MMMAYQGAVALRGDHVYTWEEARQSLKSAYARPPREPAKSIGELCKIQTR